MRISDWSSDVCSSDLPSDGEWRDLLEAHRYHEVLFDGLNRYFVADERTELDDKLRAPVNCLDEFYVPQHHWSAAHAVHHCQIEILTANQRLEQSEADCGKLQRELDDTAADRNRLSFEQGFLERQLSDLKSERHVRSKERREGKEWVSKCR